MTIPADSSPPGEYYCPACEKAFQIGDRCPNDGAKLVRLGGRIDPFLGRELDGRYTILEKLGQGGMGAVYRSSQHSVGREVAVKVISSHLVADADVIKRFLREAKLASKLSHPNAVAVLDFGQTDDGLFYLVMELVTGRTLDEVFKAEGVFKPERVVRIGAQVCDALEGAHALQIVHRDLKPSNIMVLSHGRDLVKVLDFGLAKSVAPDQAQTTMTNAGALLGTPAFMPPELALGQPCDGRADLYSLGCMLYLLGSGRLPFVAESAHELIAAHGTEQAPPMTGVPATLGMVIDRLLHKEPEGRFQSAAEARDALEAALSFGSQGSDINITPYPTLPGTPRPQRSGTELARLMNDATIAAPSEIRPRKSRAPWVVAGLLGAGGIGFGVFMVANQPAPTRVPAATAPPPKADATVAPPVHTVEPASPDVPIKDPMTVQPAAGSAAPVGSGSHSVEPAAPPPPVRRPVRRPPVVVHRPPPTPPAPAEHPPAAPPPDHPVPQGTGSGSAKKPGLPF